MKQWSNFEVGNLEWLRSDAYIDFFNSLDQDGGFFYERWGDAPVHSIAAGLLLKKEEIHFFNDIGSSRFLDKFHKPLSNDCCLQATATTPSSTAPRVSCTRRANAGATPKRTSVRAH